MITPPPALKISQVLIGALLAGLVTATIAMTVLRGRTALDPAVGRILFGIGAAILISGQLIVAILLRPKHIELAKSHVKDLGRDENPADVCAPIFQVITILRGALAEGPGLLGAVTVFLTGNLAGLALAGAAALVLAATFPTADRFAAFVEEATGTRTQ